MKEPKLINIDMLTPELRAMIEEALSSVDWSDITNKPQLADSRWKSPVADYAALPMLDNTLGDLRLVLNPGDVYQWKGSAWELIGANDTTINWGDVAGKPTTFTPSAHAHAISDVTGLETTISNHVDDETIHTTQSEKTLLANIVAVSKEPTGFTNNESISVSFDPATKKITLTGTFQAYYKGVLIPELVSGWQSQAIADASPSGGYFLRYTDAGFVFDSTPFDFSTLQIAYVYYRANGTYLFTLREPHGFMNWQAHQEFHQTIGTYKLSGGILQGYVPQSVVMANRRPDTPATSIKDEDIITVNSAHATKLYTLAYLQNGGAITSDFNNADIVKAIGSIPNYNHFDGANWVQTPMNNGQNTRYMSMWQYAKPVGSDTESQRYRYAWLQGQSVGDLASQESASPQDLNLGGLESISAELIFINQVIIRYRAQSTNDWDIYSVTALGGTKLVQTNSPGGSFLSAVSTDATLTGTGTPENPLSVVPGTVSPHTHTFSDITGTASDTQIGDRTINESIAAAYGNTGSLTQIISWFGKIIKAIVGGANWYSSPPTTITALNTAMSGKQETLQSGSNIKTINGNTILGSGDMVIASSGTKVTSSTSAPTAPTLGDVWIDLN